MPFGFPNHLNLKDDFIWKEEILGGRVDQTCMLKEDRQKEIKRFVVNGLCVLLSRAGRIYLLFKNPTAFDQN